MGRAVGPRQRTCWALKGLVWVCCLVAVLVPLCLPTSVDGATPVTKPARDVVTEEKPALAARRKEVSQLVKALGHPDSATREDAYNRLIVIGLPALEELQGVVMDASPERRQLAHQLLAEPQKEFGIQPLRRAGLQFLPVGDVEWRAPGPGKLTPIRLSVAITNVGDQMVRFCRFGTVHPVLMGPDGRKIPGGGGRDHIRSLEMWTPPLAKRQMHTAMTYRGDLGRSELGKTFGLTLYDETDEFYCFGGLKPGHYHLLFVCTSRPDGEQEEKDNVWGGWIFKPPAPPKDGIPTWRGYASPSVVVEIK